MNTEPVVSPERLDMPQKVTVYTYNNSTPRALNTESDKLPGFVYNARSWKQN